jgi:hypothetical protein
MNSLKPSTRQLIESFRYRRLAYLPRARSNDRKEVAKLLKEDRSMYGKSLIRIQEKGFRDYRLSQWAEKEVARTKEQDTEWNLAQAHAKRPNKRFY